MKRLTGKPESRMQFHLKREEESIRFYANIYSWLELNGFFSLAKIYKSYVTDEGGHLQKVRQYIIDRDCTPETPTQTEIKKVYKDVKEVILDAYSFTMGVSNDYSETSKVCLSDGDMTTFAFVQWFVNDQIEEEAKAKNLVDRINILEQSNAPATDIEFYAESLLED